MEDPTFATHPPDNSQQRMFVSSGGSSNSSSAAFVEADVVEIPPPPTWKSRGSKRNSTFIPDVIVVDDEDPDDLIIIGEKGAPNNKGKKPMVEMSAPYNSIANDGVVFLGANNNSKGNPSAHKSVAGVSFNGIDLTDMSYDDDCVMLQAHLDNLDVPTGTEANVPGWTASAGNQEVIATTSSYSPLGKQTSSAIGALKSWISKASSYKKKASKSFSKKSSTRAQSSGLVPPISNWPTTQVPNNQITLSSPYQPQNFPSEFAGVWNAAPFNPVVPSIGYVADTSSYSCIPSDRSIILEDEISAKFPPPSISGQGDAIDENPVLKKLEIFKRFDTLEDHSDHLFNTVKESVKQPKSWVNSIANEWKMLEKDLPDEIFVRVFESRMDLLRAVIIGAAGTPYHNGLFFFDVHFTHSYPKSPPHVKYHAHGLRINPNLYNCGKVCLSLLGTWSGSGVENWRSGKSNMMQVLVSIQGLILNAEPYYNEPGYASSKNTGQGKTASKNYSENAFLLSLKTMLYTMKNPPKNFEDLVFGHFYKQAHDILAECRAYLYDGVEVGSFVKGEGQAKKGKKKSCSPLLKSSLPGSMKSLVEAFTKLGVKDCEKFLLPEVSSTTIDQSAEEGNTSRRRKRR